MKLSLNLSQDFVNTDLGATLISTYKDQICYVGFSYIDVQNAKEILLEDFYQSFSVVGSNSIKSDPLLIQNTIDTINGKRVGDLPLVVFGTDFQKTVWNAIKAIPKGETASYADIAKSIGSPKSVRAVGSACGANRIAVIIPCHRVIMSNGDVGSYRWGRSKKIALLQKEKIS